ncbi:MAG: ATP-binding cassette domain-containing protein [Gallibacter sp.]|nr:ATP-binding cassette domain-containing protein [Gallibacter sp.]
MAIDVNIKSKLDNFNMYISFSSNSKRIGVLGASGAGKSMLLKCIAGIYTPDFGAISLDNDEVFSQEKKINVKPQDRNVAYMFQNYALFPTMSVRENINIIAKGDKKQKEDKTTYLLEKFQISELASKLPKELSGGQQQRVALARIMAYEPKIILLDEPFSALDESLKESLQIQMEAMISDFDGTIIMVSHNREELYRFSDEILIVNDGCVVEHGKTKDVFKSPKTIAGAKLVGVDNILEARFLDGYLEIPEWNLRLKSEVLKYKTIHSDTFEGCKENLIVKHVEKNKRINDDKNAGDAENIKNIKDIKDIKDIKSIGIRSYDIIPVYDEDDCVNKNVYEDSLGKKISDVIDINVVGNLNGFVEKKIFFTHVNNPERQYSFILKNNDMEECQVPNRVKINYEKLIFFR